MKLKIMVMDKGLNPDIIPDWKAGKKIIL